MSNCELCGRESELLRVNVEGVLVSVCSSCSKYGTLIQEEEKSRPIIISQREEVIEDLAENYSQLIRAKRTELQLSQKEFSKKLSEKESFISKLEQGTLQPTLETAHKIEKLLGIKLVTKTINESSKTSTKTQQFTIGDLIKKK